MGVPGLWNLLEPIRRPLELEQLCGKVVAIDMNIWLHQAVKSRAATGGPRRFLTVLFCRLCKLVYFGIRPVFVFDGEVPTLKKSTMAARRRLRGLLGDRAERAHERLIHRLLKRMAESTGDPSAASASGSQESTVQSNMGESTKHELLRRLIERPDVQQSHEDAKMFGAPETKDSSSEHDACGLLHENAGLEYDDLARDYLDGVRLHLLDASSQLDLHSPAFCSLPLHAQLRVVQLARDELDTYFRVSGSGQILDADGPNTTEAFSTSQIRRLLLRRQLITRQGELSAQIAREDATTQIARLNSPRLTSALSEQLQLLQASSTDSTMYTTALRIQSRDTGHAILIRKFPRESENVTAGRSNHAVSLSLDRLIHRAPDDTIDSDPPHLNNLDVVGSEVVDPDSLISSESDSCDHIQLSQKHADDTVHMFRDAQPKEEAANQTVFSASLVGTPIHEPQSPRTTKCAEISFNSPITQSNVLISPSKVVPATESSCVPSFFPSIETHLIDAEACSSPVCASVAAEPNSAEDTDDDDDLVEVPNSDNVVVSSDSLTNTSTSDEDTCANSHEMYPDTLPSLNLKEDEDTFQLDDDVLREQADRLTRQAQTTTTQCIEEAQQLLRMFGVPFVISPEEAEAQCVALQRVGLADFVASDDSDVWPFGAQTVCRHLFGAARGSSDENRVDNRKKTGNTKEPCVYRLEDVRHSLGLDSVHIIRLALLCGSDYTVGIQNVGPVTAVEILSEFSRSGGDLSCVSQWSSWLHGLEASDELVSDVVTPLEQFRSWWLTSTKTNSSADPSFNASPIRKKWLKLSPPPGFPDMKVVKAYLRPNVISHPKPFEWGSPNVEQLVKLAQTALGWRPEKTRSMLQAVLARQKTHHLRPTSLSTSMPRITNFFPVTSAKDLGPFSDSVSVLADLSQPDEVTLPSKRARKAVSRLSERATNKNDGTTTTHSGATVDQLDGVLAQLPNRSRTGRNAGKTHQKYKRKTKGDERTLRRPIPSKYGRRVVDRVTLSEENDD